MKREALFIGVNEYEDAQIRDLNYSLSDAHALKTLFELFGYETDILENPAKSDVFSAVKKMTCDLSAGDLFFFYFAGHGWTTTSGKHLLFCSDDQYEYLRYDYNIGIPFDFLKKLTESGGYNRAFVLDACRSDFITGTRGDDTTTRDLRPIGELVKDAPTTSSLAVLRSCSKYEHALEIESRKHGLFTLAMMDVLRASKESGTELLFGESLCDAVTQKMAVIARAEGIVAAQTPEFAKSGIAQVLVSGRKASLTVQPSMQAVAAVVCPVCGKHNVITDTFKCKVCGRDHLCLSHASGAPGVCVSCIDTEAEIDVPVLSQAVKDASFMKDADDDWRRREAEMLVALEAEKQAAQKAEQAAREAERAAVTKVETERKAREIAEERAKREVELKAKLDAARKAREEAERRAREIREEAIRKAGTTKTITLPGGVEMELVWCPSGEFSMGSPASEEGRDDGETQHRVRLTKGFWLGRYEVMQKQWTSVMGNNPSRFKGDDLPVERVSWDDCQAFIQKVNAYLNRGVRLPTEAEWEYACRARTTTAYCWGNALNGNKANCNGNYPCGTRKKGPFLAKTTLVGRYGANAWGFADMHGNVWEWCADWYDDYSGDAIDPTGPSSGDRRVLRGGSWTCDARSCRSAYRSSYGPSNRCSYCGFRLCCSAGPRGPGAEP